MSRSEDESCEASLKKLAAPGIAKHAAKLKKALCLGLGFRV